MAYDNVKSHEKLGFHSFSRKRIFSKNVFLGLILQEQCVQSAFGFKYSEYMH